VGENAALNSDFASTEGSKFAIKEANNSTNIGPIREATNNGC
jgi:hypothetical protein